MGIMLGGTNERFHRVHGDIVASYTYVNDERAMILYPKNRRNGVTPYCVCDSAAWKYDDPQYLAQQAKVACDLFGWEASTQAWYRIAKVIHEGLGDLLRLPPSPQSVAPQGPVIGEAELMIGGKTITGAEITAPTPDELARYDSGVIH